MRKLRQRDRQHGAARSQIQRVARRLTTCHPMKHFQAAGGGAMMTGAEGKACLDLDRKVADAPPVAVMRAMDQKPAGTDRLQAFQRLGDPVDVGQRLMRDLERCTRRAGGDADAVFDVVRLGGVGIDGNFLRTLRFVDLEDGEGEAVILEFAFQQAEKRRRIRPRGDEMQACLGHGDMSQPAARRLSLAIAVSGFSP